MKVEIKFYKDRFKITKQEVEEYWKWHWLSEPEIKTEKDVETRLDKLRKQVAWTRKIGDKYCEAFKTCGRWSLNSTTQEITIL